MQLLWSVVTYLSKKNVKHGIEHDVLDSPYGVCMHTLDIPEIYGRFIEYLAI